jgi:hypothetical protein
MIINALFGVMSGAFEGTALGLENAKIELEHVLPLE